MSPLLQVEELRKRVGDRELLAARGLALDPGELVVLTGDNGSGKTTLLKILAGLEHADRLRMRFEGVDASERRYPAGLRRRIVYVHQHPYLFNSSVRANLEYGLRLRALAPQERERRVQEAMAWANLAQVAQVAPRRLSGGEKQRVALARVHVLEPRAMLVDEPTANLDAASRAQVIELLRATATGDNCVLVACHDRELIDLPGARRWHLEAGRIVE